MNHSNETKLASKLVRYFERLAAEQPSRWTRHLDVARGLLEIVAHEHFRPVDARNLLREAEALRDADGTALQEIVFVLKRLIADAETGP